MPTGKVNILLRMWRTEIPTVHFVIRAGERTNWRQN